MQITVPLENHYLADRFGKHAPAADTYQGYPKRSFPITIDQAPANTQSFAVWLIDYDAVPVSGFPWIHWNIANIPGTTTQLPEDASRKSFASMVQGRNANAGGLVHNPDLQIATGYVGPQPPNADHAYTLTVFALDTMLDLKPGFWLNEARHAMAGHILEETSIDLWSRV